eukprot:1196335-Prorocentrum_minimum.AAC.1
MRLITSSCRRLLSSRVPPSTHSVAIAKERFTRCLKRSTLLAPANHKLVREYTSSGHQSPGERKYTRNGHQSRKGRENIPVTGTNRGRGERIYP